MRRPASAPEASWPSGPTALEPVLVSNLNSPGDDVRLRSRVRKFVPELESLQLARGRARQRVGEAKFRGALEGREKRGQVRPQLLRRLGVARASRLEDDEGHDAVHTVGVRPRNNRRLVYVGAGEQCVFNLAGEDPHAFDLEEVVAAPLEPVEAFLVAPVDVARSNPFALNRRRGLLRLHPVTRARAQALDEKVALARARYLSPRAVNYLRLVAGDDFAAAPRFDFVTAIGDEHL